MDPEYKIRNNVEIHLEDNAWTKAKYSIGMEPKNKMRNNATIDFIDNIGTDP